MERTFQWRTFVTFPLLMKASPLKRLYGFGQTNFVVVDHEGIIRYRSRDNYEDTADVPAIRAGIQEALSILAAARAGQGSATSVAADLALPAGFSLTANFPNPFNAATRIRYSVGTEGPVSLEVFDVTGRRVRRLMDRQWSAPGAYDLRWDGRNEEGVEVASGVYIYRLFARDQTVSRRMMLVR